MKITRTSGADPDRKGLEEFVVGDPRLQAVREAVDGLRAYLVGGSVRDLLLGRQPGDLDVVVEGPLEDLLDRLDPKALRHPRFMTATVSIEGGKLDVARSRSEIYPAPGALPEVRPAPIDEDLARRDFTVNAIAVPLDRPGELLDPFDGETAIAEGRLTLLHRDSLADDPTRALRGARYSARFGFEPDREMVDALRKLDLSTVSRDRVEAEFMLLGSETKPEEALEIARRWGVVELAPDLAGVVRTARQLVSEGSWEGFASQQEIVEAALKGGQELPVEPPGRLIEQYELIEHCPPAELVLARARGRAWLDWWPEWGSGIELEIDGDDLVEAGIEPGPPVGAGLRAALAECLEERGTERSRQLKTALAAARNATQA